MAETENFDPTEPAGEMQEAFDARIKFASTFRFENHRIPSEEELDAAVPVQVVKPASCVGAAIQRRLFQQKTEKNGVIGISYSPKKKRWIASISRGRGSDVIACCLTAVEAAKEYNRAARRIRGKYAVLCDLEAAARYQEEVLDGLL